MNEGFNSLEEAVLCFYDSNNVHRSEAQKWLTELQSSPRIWSAIWDELLPSKVSTIEKTFLYNFLIKIFLSNFQYLPFSAYSTSVLRSNFVT